TTRTLARIPDSRASQFWEPHPLIAEDLRRALESIASLPKPSCCVDHGHFWDMAAVFAPEVRAKGMLPAPVFFDGAVVSKESAIRSKLNEILSSQSLLGQH